MSLDKKIETFFQSKAFGVIGASSNRQKFGNKVLRVYIEHNKKVFPVNPKETKIEGLAVIPDINHLPDDVKSISVITPPKITEEVVKQAIAKGIKNIWMQPGAESDAAIKLAEENNVSVIAKGPCILVIFGFQNR